MKYSTTWVAVFAVIACGGSPADDAVTTERHLAPEASAVAVEEGPAFQEFELPFGLPLAPDSRLDNADEFEGPVERIEGHGSLATTGAWRDVMAFYEQALVDAGFEATRTVETEAGYSLSGERGRDRFRIYPNDRFADLRDGETGLKYVASWDKE